MKKIFIVVPRGFGFVELSYPKEIEKSVARIKISVLSNLPNGAKVKFWGDMK